MSNQTTTEINYCDSINMHSSATDLQHVRDFNKELNRLTDESGIAKVVVSQANKASCG